MEDDNPTDNPQVIQSTVNGMSHRFTTTLEEDDFGDLILTIPYEICEELGWDIGTDLDYDIVDNESFVLKKAKDE